MIKSWILSWAFGYRSWVAETIDNKAISVEVKVKAKLGNFKNSSKHILTPCNEFYSTILFYNPWIMIRINLCFEKILHRFIIKAVLEYTFLQQYLYEANAQGFCCVHILKIYINVYYACKPDLILVV